MNVRERSLVKVFQQTAEWSGGHFQGDIRLQDGRLPEVSCFNAVCSKEQLWPDCTVYYSINEKDYSMDHIESIEEALKIIEKSTDCIKFFRTSKDSKNNYVEITLPPAGESGYSTYVGMSGGKQPLYLDHQCLHNHGTVMHAFMHVLGLHHEHVREDRDAHVNIHWENIDEGYWQHFSKLDNTLINKYDTDSILHWGTNAFCNDRSHHTVTSKNSSIQIGQREKLSDMDVERLQILYEAKTPKQSQYFKTFNTRDIYKPAKWVHKTPSPTTAKSPPQSSESSKN